MKPIYFLGCALAFAPCCAHVAAAPAPVVAPANAQRERDATAATLVRLMAAQLGGTRWKVDYEPQYDLITVESQKPAWIEPEAILNDSPFEKRKPTSHLFGFSLRVQPLISPAEHARLSAENKEIETQLQQMAAQMKDISHKFDSFSPRDTEQKRRVDAYNLLKAKRHSLPHFYFGDISLAVNSYTHQPIFEPVALFDESAPTATEPQWQIQQKRAAHAVAQLLTRYPATSR